MVGMIGRKVGMMRLYDGAGRARAVTVIELGPNRVTQLRTAERDGYEAVQVGFSGNRKRINRPERGHLRLLWGPTLARPEQVAERVTSRCRFVGDAVALHGDQIEAALGRDALLLPFSRYHPAGGTVALQGMRALAAGRAVPIGAVEPCYVRSAWAQIHRAQEIESSLTTKGAV